MRSREFWPLLGLILLGCAVIAQQQVTVERLSARLSAVEALASAAGTIRQTPDGWEVVTR